MKSVLEGFALVWLGVLMGVFLTWLWIEIRFRLALWRLMRDASKAAESTEGVMW